MKSAKILVVDDEASIVDMLGRYLKLEGYLVEGTTSANEAVKKIQAGGIGVVIFDLSMPEMHGLDLLREIKKWDGLIQPIVITGYVTMENVLSAFRLGAVNCFFKPFDSLDALGEEVKQAFAKRRRINEVLAGLRDLKEPEHD